MPLIAASTGKLTICSTSSGDLPSIQEGDAVEFWPQAQPELRFQARVARLGDVIDSINQSASVRVEVSNPDRALRPGQGVRARITATRGATTRMAVPSEAIIIVDGRPTVFVSKGPHTVEIRPISEIYQFVVRSPQHSPTQLRTLLDWEIVPKLRSVPGVIEVNTMGGDLKQYQVIIDPGRLRMNKLTLRDVRTALERASGMVGAGYLERSGESLAIRGIGLLRTAEEIGEVALPRTSDGAPVLVRHVGRVVIGAALRNGTVTRDGEGEAVSGVVMMLLGANSREVVTAVKDRIARLSKELPPGVSIEPVYDRSDFVNRTLSTVLKNLVEGALVVGLVLALLLGTFRGALVVVLGIPASMAVALFGMQECTSSALREI